MRKAVRRKPSPQPPAGRVMRRPQAEASVQDRVGMRRSREMRAGPPPSAGGMSGGSGIVRRACGANCTCAACREEESGTQGSKAEQGGGGVLRRAPENAQDADLRVYPKLVLGAPDDPVERAADTAADKREERRGGNECVSTCRSTGTPVH